MHHGFRPYRTHRRFHHRYRDLWRLGRPMDVGHRNQLPPHQRPEHYRRNLDDRHHRHHRQILDETHHRHLPDEDHQDVHLGRRHQPDEDHQDAGLAVRLQRMGCFQPALPLGEECPCLGSLRTGCYQDEEYQQEQQVLLEPKQLALQEPLEQLALPLLGPRLLELRSLVRQPSVQPF
jgi:hypothetical protein